MTMWWSWKMTQLLRDFSEIMKNILGPGKSDYILEQNNLPHNNSIYCIQWYVTGLRGYRWFASYCSICCPPRCHSQVTHELSDKSNEWNHLVIPSTDSIGINNHFSSQSEPTQNQSQPVPVDWEDDQVQPEHEIRPSQYDQTQSQLISRNWECWGAARQSQRAPFQSQAAPISQLKQGPSRAAEPLGNMTNSQLTHLTNSQLTQLLPTSSNTQSKGKKKAVRKHRSEPGSSKQPVQNKTGTIDLTTSAVTLAELCHGKSVENTESTLVENGDISTFKELVFHFNRMVKF